ncbi:MAG: hypothetical protein QGG36_15035 [Pirellulaceae bacterium]|nr:hypothetical protein [Pirellulaceae bacterium]
MSASNRFDCPQCGKSVKAPPGEAGQQFRCPKCQAVITAPTARTGGPASAPSLDDDDFFWSDAAAAGTPPPAEPEPPPTHSEPGETKADRPPAADGPRKADGGGSQTAESTPQPESPVARSKPAGKAIGPTIAVRCQACKTRLDVPETWGGKSVRCPDCHSPIPIPIKSLPAQQPADRPLFSNGEISSAARLGQQSDDSTADDDIPLLGDADRIDSAAETQQATSETTSSQTGEKRRRPSVDEDELTLADIGEPLPTEHRPKTLPPSSPAAAAQRRTTFSHKCPHCSEMIVVTDKQIGAKYQCRQCQISSVIAAPNRPTPPPESPPDETAKPSRDDRTEAQSDAPLSVDLTDIGPLALSDDQPEPIKLSDNVKSPTDPDPADSLKLQPLEFESLKPEPLTTESLKPEQIKPEPLKPEPLKPEPLTPEPLVPKSRAAEAPPTTPIKRATARKTGSSPTTPATPAKRPSVGAGKEKPTSAPSPDGEKANSKTAAATKAAKSVEAAAVVSPMLAAAIITEPPGTKSAAGTKSAPEAPVRQPDDPFRPNAAEVMREAEAESEQTAAQTAAEAGGFAGMSAIGEVQTMFTSPGAWFRLLLLSALFMMVTLPGTYAFEAVFGDDNGGSSFFIGLGLTAFVMVVIAPTSVYCCAVFAAIMQDSSSGSRHVHDWPSFVFADCMAAAAFFLLAMFYSIMPGGFLVLLMVGAPAWLTLPVFWATVFLVYPFVLMSMMEGGSLLSLISMDVVKGVQRAPRMWAVFYAQTAVIAIASYVTILGLRALPIAYPFVALVEVFCAMAYFRMLGVLAWRTAQADAASQAAAE